ncbi:MAG TPA: MMPL family transporter [Solirubrobacteraceae bacterium]|nr:MMPL family transporter [Solirubrobacteraceae bacterium]
MAVKEMFEGAARLAARRPALTVAIVLTLAIAGGLVALGLKPSAGTDTFVSRSSADYRATALDHREFGGDAVAILIREPLRDLVDTKDLAKVTFLEACLAGQYAVPSEQLQAFQPAPAGAHPPYGGWGSPCGKLMKAKPVQVVYGPGTFLNQAVAAVNRAVSSLLANARSAVIEAQSAAHRLALARGLGRAQAAAAAKAAGALEGQQQLQQLERLYLDSGINGAPRIDNAQFIDQVVFDATRGANQPKSRFAYLFPTAGSALIQVRLKASLSTSQQAAAIAWIRDAVKMPDFRLGYGGTYTVTGAPVLVNDLESQITGAIAGLLIAALLVMAATLLIVFRSRLRLLPLAIALAASGITFGALSLAGGTLTMASIAVLPILIGLAVDYAIQFQSRAEEARRAGAPSTGERAVARATSAAAPTIAAAALASAVGFLALLLSPVPMVRGFGMLLVVGIAIALVCALTLGSAAIVLSGRDGGLLGASLRGATEILRDLRPAAPARGKRAARNRTSPTPVNGTRSQRALAALVAHPGRVLAVGAALAVLGWVADTQTAVQSDVTKLVPASMPALRDLRTLERVTGVSGEIDVVVHADNVATPAVVGWMVSYEQALMAHYGYLETKGCARSTLCPALSLPDLFSTGSQTAAPTQAQINSLLAAVPRYFSQAVITPDHHSATLAFGIRLMPLSKQQRVIEYMSSQLHPPPGVTARLAGLPVLAAQANAALSSSGRRLLMLLAGLIAVGLVLLLVFRSPRRALVPLVPIVLATGWSAVILFATGIPLNPMSATLGALVIAISTEFSVLLSERFREERDAGHELPEALGRTYRSTGLAVLASGITAIAGFGVLVLSDISMLRDFGFVTVIDLTVSLVGVLLVLPAVLAVSERGDLRVRLRSLVTLPRLRRRPRIA